MSSPNFSSGPPAPRSATACALDRT
jgi:hypothetical protein